MSDVGRRAARSGATQIVAQVATQLLRLVSNLVMTRLLLPEAFGLLAIIQAVLLGLQLLSDVGTWQTIVRSPRDDRAFLDTAFTLHVMRGVALFVVGAACAVPAAWLYDRPEFLLMMPVAALQALIFGFESTKLPSAVRQVKLGRLTALEIGTQVVTLMVSVPLAIVWQSAWALIVATVVSALVRVVLSHVWLEGPINRFQWDKTAIKEFVVFGRWALVSSALFFLCGRWDAFALGKLEGMALLGVYGLALLIVSVPSAIGDRLIGVVVAPALADSFRSAPERFDAALKRALGSALPTVGALFLGAAFTAPAFFRLLYLDAYHDAGWMTQLVLVGAWCSFVGECSTRALLAVGDARSLAMVNLARLVALVPLTLGLFHFYGFMGFLIGAMIAALIGTGAGVILLRAHQLHVARVVFLSLFGVIVLGVIGAGLPAWLAPQVGVDAAWLTLISVPVLFAPVAALAVRRTRQQMRDGL